MVFLFLILNILAFFFKYNFENYNDNYASDDSLRENFAFYSELVCNIFFVFEWIVQIIAMGLLLGNNTYFKSGWHILDFTSLLFRYYFINLNIYLIPLNSFLQYFPNSQLRDISLVLKMLRPFKILHLFSCKISNFINVFLFLHKH